MRKSFLMAAFGAAVAFTATAQTVLTEGEWQYTTDGSSATVVKFTPGPSEDEYALPTCNVPATLGGLPVTAIGPSACEGLDIAGLSFPKTVKTIGARAFYGCNNLYNEIDLRHVQVIGDSAFCNTALSMYLAEPNYQIGIGAFAFYISYNNTWGPAGHIYIPHGKKDKYVHMYASDETQPLWYHFNDPRAWEEVYYDEGGLIYNQQEIWNNEQQKEDTVWCVFNGKLAEGHVTVLDEIEGEPVRAIGHNAFRDMSGGHAGENPRLTGITLSDNITLIQMGAFLGCYNLESIDLKNVRQVDYATFVNCEGLKEVHFRLPADQMTFGPMVFNYISDEGGFDEHRVIPAVIYVPRGEKQNYIDMWAQEPDEWVESPNTLYYFLVDGRLLEEGDTPPEPNTRGDLTGDNTVDVDDLNLIINMMLHKADETAAADLNHDGSVDVDDLNTIINIMLHKEQ